MITVLAPCDLNSVVITDSWADHVARPGYYRDYAGTDYARSVSRALNLRGSQFNGKVTQAMWSNSGYGYTTFVDYNGILRIRNAHQKNLGVAVGQIVTPETYLGTMNSTGNSTGDHTHWEVWIKRNSKWTNIDPYNPSNGIQIVNTPEQLIPLDQGEIEMPLTTFTIPSIPSHQKVKTTSIVSKWVNIRELPKVNSLDWGDIKSGEQWDLVGVYEDAQKNIWFAICKDQRIGWAAAYYMGETWLQVVS